MMTYASLPMDFKTVIATLFFLTMSSVIMAVEMPFFRMMSSK